LVLQVPRPNGSISPSTASSRCVRLVSVLLAERLFLQAQKIAFYSGGVNTNTRRHAQHFSSFLASWCNA